MGIIGGNSKMSNQTTAYQQYKEVQVKTANRGKLLIILYQGCIKFLRLAKKGIQDNNIEMANNNIIKSQKIIIELMSTLNREKGGEIADNLYSLYDYMNRQLIEANIKKNLAPIEIVEELMLELLDSWQQLVNGGKREEENETKVRVKG